MFNSDKKILKDLKPRKEFTEKAKAAFLTVFDAAHPASAFAVARPHGFALWAKGLVAAVAFAAVFVGMSVYADTANVNADSPLYSLKRLSESVQLAVSPAPEKAQLEATFATRRAKEIGDLETRKPSSTVAITDLSDDLDAAVSSSLRDAKKADLGDGQLSKFCDKVSSLITNPGIGKSHSNIIERFVGQCGVDTTTTSSDGEQGDTHDRGLDVEELLQD